MSKRDLEDNLMRDKSYGKNKQLGIAHDLNTVVASQLVQKKKKPLWFLFEGEIILTLPCRNPTCQYTANISSART